jgi:hypothetical protein
MDYFRVFCVLLRVIELQGLHENVVMNFVYCFVCGLFNDAVIISDCVASSGGMITEL